MSKFPQSEGRSLFDIPFYDNTTQKYLKPEAAAPQTGDKIHPRQVKGCHFTYVLPEPVPKAELVIVSEDCSLSELGLNPQEAYQTLFPLVFSGSKLIEGFNKSYCTVYGCHSYGSWFGQLGDGRAVILGEVHHFSEKDREETKRYFTPGIRELQLKGSGRSPYSRGFDGRAVLRSSIREFLVSEAMHHLRVPTTRALSVSINSLPLPYSLCDLLSRLLVILISFLNCLLILVPPKSSSYFLN
jgi:uncharacterized protein YdiU (UPF0061 family)